MALCLPDVEELKKEEDNKSAHHNLTEMHRHRTNRHFRYHNKLRSRKSYNPKDLAFKRREGSDNFYTNSSSSPRPVPHTFRQVVRNKVFACP